MSLGFESPLSKPRPATAKKASAAAQGKAVTATLQGASLATFEERARDRLEGGSAVPALAVYEGGDRAADESPQFGTEELRRSLTDTNARMLGGTTGSNRSTPRAAVIESPTHRYKEERYLAELRRLGAEEDGQGRVKRLTREDIAMIKELNFKLIDSAQNLLFKMRHDDLLLHLTKTMQAFEELEFEEKAGIEDKYQQLRREYMALKTDKTQADIRARELEQLHHSAQESDNERITQLERANRTADREIARLKDQLHQKDLDAESVQRELRSLRQQLDDAQSRLRDANGMQGRLAELEAENAQWKSKQQSLKQHLETLTTTLRLTEQRMQGIDEDRAAAEKVKAQLREARQDNETTEQKLRETRAALEGEKQRLRTLEENKSATAHDLQELRLELRHTKERLAVREREALRDESEIARTAQLQQEVDELRTLMHSLKREKNTLADELRSQQEAAAAAPSVLDEERSRQEVSRLLAKVKAQEEEIDYLQRQLSRAREGATEAASSSAARLTALQQRLQQLQPTTDKGQRDTQQQQQHAADQEELNRLRSDLRQSAVKLQQKDEEIARLVAELEASLLDQRDFDGLRAELAKLKESNAELRRQWQAEANERDWSQREIAKLHQQRRQTNEQLRTASQLLRAYLEESEADDHHLRASLYDATGVLCTLANSVTKFMGSAGALEPPHRGAQDAIQRLRDIQLGPPPKRHSPVIAQPAPPALPSRSRLRGERSSGGKGGSVEALPPPDVSDPVTLPPTLSPEPKARYQRQLRGQGRREEVWPSSHLPAYLDGFEIEGHIRVSPVGSPLAANVRLLPSYARQ